MVQTLFECRQKRIKDGEIKLSKLNPHPRIQTTVWTDHFLRRKQYGAIV